MYKTTLLPSVKVNSITAQGVLCAVKYTHTLTSVIKQQSYVTKTKDKTSLTDQYIKDTNIRAAHIKHFKKRGK